MLDLSIIASAYAKKQLKQYIDQNSILYINPNKNRTNKWLSLNRLQLPVGETKRGSIRRISYLDGKVKIQNSIHMTQMQEKLYKAGVIDEYVQDDEITIADLHTLVNQFYKNFNPPESSKVVDKDGKPLVVYHQTGADFTVIKNAIKNKKVIDYDAKKRNELSVIAKNVNLGNITPSFLNNNLSQFKNGINSFKEKNRINYSDRFTEIDRDYLSAVERGDDENQRKRNSPTDSACCGSRE